MLCSDVPARGLGLSNVLDSLGHIMGSSLWGTGPGTVGVWFELRLWANTGNVGW